MLENSKTMKKEPKKGNFFGNTGEIDGDVDVSQTSSFSYKGRTTGPMIIVGVGIAIAAIAVFAVLQSNGSGNNDAEKLFKKFFRRDDLTNIQITSMECKSKSAIVVIENVGDASQDLTDWKIKDHSANYAFNFEDDFSLEPGSSVKLISGESGDNSNKTIYWNSKPVWNNDGDTASLYNSSSELVSEMKCP